MAKDKAIYLFGDGKAEGNGKMKEILGGKGAGLAEMNRIGVPVPAGFTITTQMCIEYNGKGQDHVIHLIEKDLKDAVANMEKIMDARFGDPANPLLVSVRSGARVSMPGMMDTVLNLGLNEEVVEGLAKISGSERFAWDSYRRFVQMYGDVVLDMKPETRQDQDPFEEIIERMKHERKVEADIDLTTDDLKELVVRFKNAVKARTGRDFPTDPWEQLWGAIWAVFNSWNNERAIYFRRMHNFSDDWGTAVNVQAMVFGNMGDDCATGVAFTRDAGSGENIFNGEFLINAQGEDVVAGIRTPQEITIEGSRRWAKRENISEQERKTRYPSLEEAMPEVYKQLDTVQQKLEKHFRDMQDLEFTIQKGKLWLLQTRTGKRTGPAMVKIAMDMLAEGMIDEKTALSRIDPSRLDELLHPVFDKDALAQTEVIARGLPASPGAATGQIVFFADDAEIWKEEGKKTILVRIETSPEDLKGMNSAEGILTARGGMTSHAAVVARGMGKCCVSGAGSLRVDYPNRTLTIGEQTWKEGDWISLNGTTGEVYDGKVNTIAPALSGDFGKLMELCDRHTRMKVRTNADTPKDAAVARKFGAMGIGLCRTEHMFFEGDRIESVREMILAKDLEGRKRALDKLLPMQRGDFEGIFEAMDGLPVTVRLLDPPLHEFLPDTDELRAKITDLKMKLRETTSMAGINEIIDEINKLESLLETVEKHDEVNPMLGHRGCRLGNTFPEISRMQTRAIIEAALNVKSRGVDPHPEIMIPLTGKKEEMAMQEQIVRETVEKVFAERGEKVDFLVGTMIEIPRAALTADQIAEHAEFFSFGTNDLTQMTFGYSRDDVGKFLPIYIKKGILEVDPFQVLDQTGVGQLVEMGTRLGRKTRSDLKVGICGEHGGEPSSVKFCHKVGMNYVSCSPYRVPIARLAAAQAAVEE